MSSLKSFFKGIIISLISIILTISVYGIVSNPYSSSLDSKTVSSLDSIVELVKKKGLSLSEENYFNLVSAISNRLKYLDYEMVNIKDSLSAGGNNGGSGNITTICAWQQYQVAPSPLPPKPNRECSCGEKEGIYECKKTIVYGDTGETWTKCTDGSLANPILNGAEDRTIRSLWAGYNSYPYDGDFGNLQGTYQPWPNFGVDIQLSITKNKYVAAKFTTEPVVRTGRLRYTLPTSIEGPPPVDSETGYNGRTMSISTCPGDFNNHLGQEYCKTQGGPTIHWSTAPEGSIFGHVCYLKPNTTYYLNIVDSDNSENDNYATSDCKGKDGYCGFLGLMSAQTD